MESFRYGILLRTATTKLKLLNPIQFEPTKVYRPTGSMVRQVTMSQSTDGSWRDLYCVTIYKTSFPCRYRQKAGFAREPPTLAYTPVRAGFLNEINNNKFFKILFFTIAILYSVGPTAVQIGIYINSFFAISEQTMVRIYISFVGLYLMENY